MDVNNTNNNTNSNIENNVTTETVVTQETVLDVKQPTNVIEEAVKQEQVSTEETGTTDELVWKETGDNQVDTIGRLAYKANIKPESLIEELLEHNDLTKETIEKLEAKHGKEVTNLLIKEIKDLHTKNIEKIEADNQGVYDTMSSILGIDSSLGKQGWEELTLWAKGNVPEADANALSELLQQGGLAAKLAARELTEFYLEQTGKSKHKVTQQPEIVKGSNNAPTDKLLSKNEFLEQKRELEKKYGYDSPEVERLRALRRKSINAGYN